MKAENSPSWKILQRISKLVWYKCHPFLPSKKYVQVSCRFFYCQGICLNKAQEWEQVDTALVWNFFLPVYRVCTVKGSRRGFMRRREAHSHVEAMRTCRAKLTDLFSVGLFHLDKSGSARTRHKSNFCANKKNPSFLTINLYEKAGHLFFINIINWKIVFQNSHEKYDNPYKQQHLQ